MPYKVTYVGQGDAVTVDGLGLLENNKPVIVTDAEAAAYEQRNAYTRLGDSGEFIHVTPNFVEHLQANENLTVKKATKSEAESAEPIEQALPVVQEVPVVEEVK